MKIVLIGHQGYIGSGLYSYLTHHHQVLGWGRKEDLFSLTQRDLIKKKIDAVVNCAVITERANLRYDVMSATHHMNVEGARHLANILKNTHIGWVQISTKDVFGPVFGKKSVVEHKNRYSPRFFVDETQPFNPITLYAKSKLMSEFIAETHPYSAIVRLSSCYSDFDHYRGNWMVNLIRSSFEGTPVTVSHNGKQFRDPLHTDDLGRLIENVIEKELYGESFNAGGGSKNLVSLLEFLGLIEFSSKVKLVNGSDYGFAFDIRKATKLAHWSPTVLLKERLPLLIKNIQHGLTTAIKQ